MSMSRPRQQRFGSAVAALTLAAWITAPVSAQDVTRITFVQPSPSAINPFPVFVAIGEGCFAEEGLEVTVEAINGSGPVLQTLKTGPRARRQGARCRHGRQPSRSPNL
jgi:NitT/TauT family transport system substrate-binding protein